VVIFIHVSCIMLNYQFAIRSLVIECFSDEFFYGDGCGDPAGPPNPRAPGFLHLRVDPLNPHSAESVLAVLHVRTPCS
jgi:hypothetical protein